jgi:hypothetical protein
VNHAHDLEEAGVRSLFTCCLAARMNGYGTKPIHLAQLWRAIAEVTSLEKWVV